MTLATFVFHGSSIFFFFSGLFRTRSGTLNSLFTWNISFLNTCLEDGRFVDEVQEYVKCYHHVNEEICQRFDQHISDRLP